MITGTLGYVIGKWLMERRQPEQESTEERRNPVKGEGSPQP
jgi:hypothetical protein